MTFEEISDRLGCCKRHVIKLHDAALRKIRNALRDDELSHRNLADEMGFPPLDSKHEPEAQYQMDRAKGKKWTIYGS